MGIKGVSFMKKWIAFLTTMSVALGSMGVTAFGATFADIDTVPWSGAKTFIEQAASLGLISGYDEGGKKYCKPRNNVTYCETVQLMYSVMRVYTKQDVSDTVVTKWKPVIQAYNIPEWAYKAVSYGLENSILTTTDLNDLRNGTKAADREAVGVIFGKAFATIDGYSLRSDPSLSYNDAAKVSAAAKPYLDLLYRANLMVGDTNNNFNPQSNINRAEMSVLTVKAYQKLADGKQTETPSVTTGSAVGSVEQSMLMSNGDLFLSVKTNSGGGLSLFAQKGKLTPKYEGESITFSDVKQGDTVKLTYEGQYIQSLEVTYSKYGIATQATGEITDLSDSRITIETKSGKEETYRLLSSVDVELDGKDSTISKVERALEDAKYDATLTINADSRVTKIVATKNANNPTEGTLTDLDKDEITIKAGNRSYTYPLTEGDLTIKNGSKTMTFSKLQKDYDEYNYTVSLKLNSKNEVTTITIQDQEDETKGTLTFINSRRLTIDAAGEEYTYYFTEKDVDVTIDGKSKSLDDLKKAFNDEEKAFTVEVDDVDRDDYVGEIIATSKNASASEGEIVKVTNGEITVKQNGKEVSYSYAADMKVKINGKTRTLADLKSGYEDVNFTVKLEFDNRNRVTTIEAEMQEPTSGELRDIREDKDRITIEVSGVSVELDLASDVDITLDGDDITLKKLNSELDYTDSKNHINVTLKYNSKGEVRTLQARWNEDKPDSGDLYRVSYKNDEITIKDKNGDRYTYDVASDVTLRYSFSANVNERNYDDPSDYRDSLRGLEDFFADCEKNNDDCYVTLTLDKNGEVTRIGARAE